MPEELHPHEEDEGEDPVRHQDDDERPLTGGEAERLGRRVTAALATYPTFGVLSLLDGTLHGSRSSRWGGIYRGLTPRPAMTIRQST
jgi:hypothetical protein